MKFLCIFIYLSLWLSIQKCGFVLLMPFLLKIDVRVLNFTLFNPLCAFVRNNFDRLLKNKVLA